MSSVSSFLKQNKKIKPNAFFPASTAFLDDEGNPVLWEIRPIDTKEDEQIREACSVEVQVTGKPGLFRNKVDTSLYMAQLCAAAVVFPDLRSTELMESYGVISPADLLKEMLSAPGEYNSLVMFIQEYNGFNITMAEKQKTAKN